MHRIWQKHNIMPHEVYALDRSHKAFLYASEEIEIEFEIAEDKRMQKEMAKGGK